MFLRCQDVVVEQFTPAPFSLLSQKRLKSEEGFGVSFNACFYSTLCLKRERYDVLLYICIIFLNPFISAYLFTNSSHQNMARNRHCRSGEGRIRFRIGIRFGVGNETKVHFKRLDLRFLEIGVLRVIFTKRDPEFPGISGQVV
eukprot:sb/3474062/